MTIGALILMGGQNTRMGGNIKGLLKINEVTFLEKIYNTLDDFSSIYLSINKKSTTDHIRKYKEMGLNIIVDIVDDIGPMGGIYSSLKYCKEDYLFVTACDMPYINKKLINILKESIKKDTDVVVFSKDKIIYPLGAIYSKRTIHIMEELISNNEYKLLKLVQKSNFIELPIEKIDLSKEHFENINTPEEYEQIIIKQNDK